MSEQTSAPRCSALKSASLTACLSPRSADFSRRSLNAIIYTCIFIYFTPVAGVGSLGSIPLWLDPDGGWESESGIGVKWGRADCQCVLVLVGRVALCAFVPKQNLSVQVIELLGQPEWGGLAQRASCVRAPIASARDVYIARMFNAYGRARRAPRIHKYVYLIRIHKYTNMYMHTQICIS